MDRGQRAVRPSAVPARGWFDILKRSYRRMGEVDLGLMSAGVAFFALLSLFPLITALVAIGGLVLDPAILVDGADSLQAVMPDAVGEIVLGQMREVTGSNATGLSIAAVVSIALALWSASRATENTVKGLNTIYEEEETRGMIALTVLKLALTLAGIAWLTLAIAVAAALPPLLTFLWDRPWLGEVALWLRWPVLLVMAALAFAALYRFGPDRRAAQMRWLTPGAATACVLWVAGSLGFSLYVQSFGTYNETFGALGGVIVLMTWLWISAQVVLLGAVIDAELEAQTRHDTTVGEQRPMGQRGAVKADTCASLEGSS